LAVALVQGAAFVGKADGYVEGMAQDVFGLNLGVFGQNCELVEGGTGQGFMAYYAPEHQIGLDGAVAFDLELFFGHGAVSL
jgi:hypothetical protein